MLYLIALNARGASGASMLWRDDGEGRLLRIGEHPTCDLRLPGAGIATCDLWFESRVWRVRRPDGSVSAVADGDSIIVGHWMLMLIVGDFKPEDPQSADTLSARTRSSSAIEHGSSRPWLEREGWRLAELSDDLPVMIGGGDFCAVHIPWTREAVAAVIRRDGRATRCYPVAGTTLSRNGTPIAAPVVLTDGDDLALDDAPAIRYVDPDEEIDRLLGVLRNEASDGPTPTPARVLTATERVASVVGTRPEALLSVWETALAAGTLTAVLTQCAVTIARW